MNKKMSSVGLVGNQSERMETENNTTTKSELLKCDCGNTITDYEEICMDCEGMSWDERNTCEEEQ